MVKAEKQIAPAVCVSDSTAASNSENFGVNATSIQKSFQTWLQVIAPVAATPPPSPARALTTEERIAVGLATVRESGQHRRWPKEVIERFGADEVLTHPLRSHAAAREQSGITVASISHRPRLKIASQA